MRLGLVASVLLHGIALVLYPVLMDRATPHAPPVAPTPEDPFDRAIEILALRELAPEDEPEPPPEEPLPEEAEIPVPERPAPPLDPGEVPEPGEEEEEEVRRATAAERLQPTLGDARLWAPLDREYTDLSDEERAELLLRGMIRSWNDSVAVAAALSGRATDWTYTDDQGRRWGLSPGRLHLGDFSIPLPFSFEVPPPGRREALARRQWEIDDLTRGAAAAEIRETWAERAREIRERMDRERGGGG